jgi:diaminohydroxyphosphoribosylaminopyrimidine deaminase/5-amino-6-(5-phosphoribosylamino)uracil reductase
MELLAPFATLMRESRPYVIAKWAQTADGRLITHPHEDRWISSEESRAWVHRLRARMDGVLVGVNTVLRDDPLLTARNVPIQRRCARIVLDRQLRIPLSCNLVRSAREHATLVFTGPRAASEGLARRLGDAGVEIIAAPTRGEGVDIRAVLFALGERHMTNLLVEGGPTVLGSFFREKLVDEAYVFVAPHSGALAAPEGTYRPAAFEAGLQPIAESQFMSGVDRCEYRRWSDPRRLWLR